MGLKEYRAKRDFRKTAEPPPRAGKRHAEPIFVIQKHHARRLHYDFRLEADGVLKSWAVPKEPSRDPTDKRLAVHVEDHPLDYANFHGTIPEGQYGAGKVEIWDRGTYHNVLADKPNPMSVSQAVDAGHVEVDLHGRKLNGRFALVRMGQPQRGKDNWLLIKMRDAFTTAEAEKAAKPEDKPRRETKKKTTASTRRTVQFTNVDKVMYPDGGITKGDVIDYYRRIAPRLLPFLRDRPATLERFPNGIGDAATRFWQKNLPESTPPWVLRARVPSGSRTIDYAVINDIDTLLYLVNQGTLTFHVWFSRTADINHPDFVLFDLDRSEATFAAVIETARVLHKELEREDQPAFLKTSGKRGLHVVVPWRQKGGYDDARAWAMTIAQRVVQALPDRATTERFKAKRGKRVYLDVMQNGRGLHAVPPYVLRPVPGARVSTPLAWRELTDDLDPADFNLKTIFRRLARQKRDPWAGLLDRD